MVFAIFILGAVLSIEPVTSEYVDPIRVIPASTSSIAVEWSTWDGSKTSEQGKV